MGVSGPARPEFLAFARMGLRFPPGRIRAPFREAERAMQTMERQTVAPVHRTSRRPAPWPVEFYRSAVGKKWVMALTGIFLMGYVFFHMLGNLKVYFGAEDINHYGEWLRDLLVPFFPR